MTAEQPDRRVVKLSEARWVASCQRCGRKATRRTFSTEAECHAWFLDHAATPYHRGFKRQAFDQDSAALREVVGLALKERQRVNFQRLAADLGHSVSLVQTEAGWGWRCTCGVIGHAASRYDKAAQRADGNEHVRFHLSD